MIKKVIITITAFLMIFTAGCSNKPEHKKLKAAATIFPIYDFVKNIGGNFVEPVLILPAGSSPHTFSPTVKDLKNLTGAKVIFTNGFGLDEWVNKLAKSAGIKKQVSINTQFKSIVDAHNGNPHLWMNPEYATEECKVILNTLSKIDPAHKDYYERNYKEYTKNILETAENLKKELNSLKNRNFIAFHPAYTYFAEYFGLNEIAVIERTPGREPTPKEIISIENLIKNGKVKVLFKEPQLSSNIVNTIEEDTGVKVETLDPLGGVNGRDSYTELLIYDVEKVKQALKK